MKYKDQDLQYWSEHQNLCRVFELPENYPTGYCFGGGQEVLFNMVDWYNPIPTDPMVDYLDINESTTWDEIVALNRDFLKRKDYVKPDRHYLVITDFNKTFFI